MSICTIYRITNRANDKVYIGFTSKQPKARWAQHRRIRNCPDQTSYSILHASLAKYGVENFTFEVIYQSTDYDHCLGVMEPYFIKEHDCCVLDGSDKGYNVTRGGESGMKGKKHSEATRAKMSAAKKGKPGNRTGLKLTEEQKQHLSRMNTGKRQSQETIDKITSKNRMGLMLGGTKYQGVNEFCKTFSIFPHNIQKWKVTGKAIVVDGVYTFTEEIEHLLMSKLHGIQSAQPV